METLPKIKTLAFFWKGRGKSPAGMFQPDYDRFPIGYRVGCPLSVSVVYHPELVQHFLGKEHKNLSKDIAPTTNLRYALGHGIVTAFGADWLEQRRKFQPLYPQSLSENQDREIAEIISGHVETLKAAPVRNWESLKQTMLNCLIDLNWLQLFGCRFPGNKARIIEIIFRGNKLFALAAADKIPVYDAFLKNRLAACHTNLKQEIEQALRQTDLTPTPTVDEVINLLMAGAITTSGNLLFCLLHLARNPAIMHRFEAEEQYRHLVLLENFRLYPAVWSLWYQALADMRYQDFSVAKGELLVFDLFAMHRHPDWWQKPEAFDPERFSASGSKAAGYLPFGHGPRKCLGQHLAVTIISGFLQKLTRTFRFYLNPAASIQPEFGAILFPALQPKALTFELKGNHHE